VNGISISWYREHRRSKEIAAVAGVDPVFIRSDQKLLPLRYLAQWRATSQALKAAAPSVIVVMQPPPFAVFSVLRYARKHQATVVGDLHSGVFFDPKWSWLAPRVLGILRKHGGAIVPNSELAERSRAAGVTTFVCHGLITPIERAEPPAERFVLVPLTYSRDEPVEAVLEAARLAPDVNWVLTGKAPAAVRESAPSNLRFCGFVSVEEYRRLRLEASAIIALTTQPSTMQSAGYEAVSSATPLVTVPFAVLKDYYGESAVYVDNSARQIADAAVQVLSDEAHWSARMQELRDQVVADQDEVAVEIREWLRDQVASRG